jgi:hypothetical protein
MLATMVEVQIYYKRNFKKKGKKKEKKKKKKVGLVLCKVRLRETDEFIVESTNTHAPHTKTKYRRKKIKK